MGKIPVFKILTSFLLIASLFQLSACADPAEKAKKETQIKHSEALKLKAEATKQMNDGLYSTAIGLIEKSLALEPNQNTIFYERALCYYNLFDYAKAIKDFDHFQKLEPQAANAELHMLRGISKAHLDDNWGAITDLNQARAYASEDYRIYALLANYKAKLNMNSDAIDDYKRALEQKPDLEVRPLLHYKKAILYTKEQDLLSANEDLSQALAIRADFEEALFLRAQVLAGLNKPISALADYTELLKRTPTNNKALLQRSKLLRAQKRYAEAEQDLITASSLSLALPDLKDIYLELASLYHEFGNYKAAIEIYDRALSIGSSDPELHYFKGISLAKSRQWTQARTSLLEAIKLYNDKNEPEGVQKCKLLIQELPG